ncbi:shikimate kinase [Fulvimarina sp. 2208YS6-2-32]|uniref:Shikimate kinase n=1 Tax=Fulvimarina uroteuthidis TaxID=3098149 RepID=A0ABU5HXH4_9HYPH|nr:shikimate kinase [Fulvimarina sp. 2208YS6-2-32]MDY8107833.1 shikimate kinase [Fulvimarina sp. 2208YS6-2-32]
MTSASTTLEFPDVRDRLGDRSIALVGLMGAGKTTVGRRLAAILGLPFSDSDHEIEEVSRMSVPELFEAYGEPEFRALEARVVSRLVQDGPRVLGTGGGAYINPETRLHLKTHAVTVWLKADLDTLMTRVMKRSNRPLLKTADPRATMKTLMDERYPVYAEADITIASRDVKREVIAAEAAEAVQRFLTSRATA